MSERATVVVTDDLDGVRLDRTLAVLAEVSRAQSRRMIDEGDVLLNGAPAGKGTVPHTGDQIEYPVPEEEAELVPEPIAFAVALDHEQVLVIDKPAGLVVHPGAGNKTGTLVHGLAYRYPELLALGADYRWGLVHRLDRDTSGVLLVARDAGTHEHLQQALKERTIGRTYLALVTGHLPAATGTIDAPIGRDPLRSTRMAITRDGRPATTHYRRLAEWEEVSLVEVTLETGRTHQIRVHFESIEHGVVGDGSYGETGVSGDPGRVWLHAKEIRFSLQSGQDFVVTSDLPPDLAATLDALGQPMRGSVETT